MEFASIINLAAHGLGFHDVGLAAVRVASGAFFAISGAHKLFNKGRHARLVSTLESDNVPVVSFMQWWVPFWEFMSGIMLSLGFLSAFNATVLIIICLVACCCEAKKKVDNYKPIDVADRIDDYLYLPEVLYIIMLLVTLTAGSGQFSLDYLLF